MKQKEPWDGHRHDRFFWLETQIKAEDELDARLLELCLRGIMQTIVAPINQLQKINNHDICPFCILQNIGKKNKQSYKCKEHKQRTINYNELLKIIHLIETKALELYSALNLVA